MLKKQDILEIRRFIKKLRVAKKIRKEGSTTDGGTPGFLTPKAFMKNKKAKGSPATGSDGVYIEQPRRGNKSVVKLRESTNPPKQTTNVPTINLSEISYQQFKQDPNGGTNIQKLNNRILQVGRALREISQALDHSIKLKTETSLDDSAFWRPTGRSLLKISRRLAEVQSKMTKLVDLKELAASSVKQSLLSALNKIGIKLSATDVRYNTVGDQVYEFDIYVNGEPFGFDYRDGVLTHQDVSDEVLIGRLDKPDDQFMQNLSKVFHP